MSALSELTFAIIVIPVFVLLTLALGVLAVILGPKKGNDNFVTRKLLIEEIFPAIHRMIEQAIRHEREAWLARVLEEKSSPKLSQGRVG